MGLDSVVRRAGRGVEGRDAHLVSELSFGITPIERRASLCICVLVRSQLEYIEAQSIECRHAESADIMDSWDWRTLGSWIWRTLLSPHRLAVRSTEHPPMVTERLTDADGLCCGSRGCMADADVEARIRVDCARCNELCWGVARADGCPVMFDVPEGEQVEDSQRLPWRYQARRDWLCAGIDMAASFVTSSSEGLVRSQSEWISLWGG